MKRTSRWIALSGAAYRRFWFGSAVSVVGIQLFLLGQGWLVFELSGSALDLGYLGVAAGLPNIVVSLFGGLVADRVDKTRLLVLTSFVQAFLLAVLAVLDATEVVEVWHVLALVAVVSAVTGFDWPVRQAIYPRFIERHHMMSAVALNSIVWQASRMITPALGGVLIALTDTWVLFALAVLGFIGMGFIALGLPRTPSEGPGQHSSWAAFLQGIHFIARDSILVGLIVLTYCTMLLGTSFIQIMPSVADMLGTAERGFGLLISATGAGSMLGTLVVGRFQGSPSVGRLMLACVLATGLALQGFALAVAFGPHVSGMLYLALLGAGAMGFFSAMFLISSMTVIQLRVDDEVRGRVMSLHGITYSLIPLGGMIGGALAEWWNPAWAVGINASGLFLAAVVVAVAVPRLRARLETDPHLGAGAR